MEEEEEECIVTFFADDYGWLIIEDLVAKLWERLKTAGVKAVEWSDRNNFVFDNARGEIISFIMRKKLERKRIIHEARITVYGNTIWFNTKATRWLRVYLDTKLQFKSHKSLILEKARRADNRETRQTLTKDLAPVVVGKIQVLTMPVVKFYDAEIM